MASDNSLAPRRPFEGDRSAPWKSPRTASGWNRHLATTFRSPVTTTRFQAAIAGITVPVLLLRRLAELSSGPFGLQLPRSPRFAPLWARSTLQARCLNPVPQSRSASGSRLPFGAFAPLRIKAFEPATDRKARLPETSDCLSLPAAVSIGIAAAADQRSRLASFPVGSLFLEPLGTKSYVVSKRRYSQMNFAAGKRFSSELWPRVLLQLRNTGVGFRVDKTRCPGFVPASQAANCASGGGDYNGGFNF